MYMHSPFPLSRLRPRRLTTPVLICACVLGLAGCEPPAEFSNPYAALDANSPYPELVPAAQILDQANAPARIESDDDARLAARAAALKARAARLRATEVQGGDAS